MTTLRRPACLLGLLLLVALCTPLASAAEVYAFLGDDYTSAGGVYTTSMYFSGMFVTADPLGANLSGAPVTPLTYSFSDGFYDWDSSDSIMTGSAFLVTTDSFGTVTTVSFGLEGISGPFSAPNSYLTVSPTGQDIQCSPCATLYGGRVSDAQATSPGKWGPDFDPPGGAPEPASIFLMPAALLAFAFLSRKSARRA